MAGGQVTINRCPGDPQGLDDSGGTLAEGAPGPGGCEGIGIPDGGQAAGATLGTGGGETGHGAFTDYVALEFGERCHHDEEEFPFYCWAVGSRQCSGENKQAYPLDVEAIGDGEHFLHRPAEPVQFPHA